METLALCPLCAGGKLRGDGSKTDYVSGRGFQVMSCLECGLGFINPRPTAAEIKEYYPPYYSWQEDEGGGFMNRLERFYRFQLLRYETRKLRTVAGLKGGAVLDVGCGSGDRMAAMEAEGYAPRGIELTDSVKAAMAKGRWEIVQGTVFTAAFPEQSLDAVTFYNVLEHIHAPLETLRRVRPWLNDKGMLVIQVPNRRSWQARLFGMRWSSVDAPRDLFYFDTSTLETLLSQAGYRLLKIDHSCHLLHPPALTLTLFPGLDPRFVWARDRPLLNLLSRLAWVAVTLSVGWLTVLEGLCRRGSIITAYAAPAPAGGSPPHAGAIPS